MLRVDAPENSWASILDEADLNYSATIVQLNSGYISKDKLNQIEQVISRREGLGVT